MHSSTLHCYCLTSAPAPLPLLSISIFIFISLQLRQIRKAIGKDHHARKLSEITKEQRGTMTARLQMTLMFLHLVAGPSAIYAFTAPIALDIDQQIRSVRYVGVEETADVDVASSSSTQSVSFTSPTFRVYIEDTDAYGVMYNGNYIRSYERAISHVPREDEDNALWNLCKISEQKFRSSPALGEEYVIRGEQLKCTETEDGSNEEIWKLQMVTDGKNGDDGEVVHNSAVATIRAPPKKLDTTFTTASTMNLGKMFEQTIVPYHDEFDLHTQHHIPIRSAVNFFERSRTSFLGGPDILRRMKEEDDILWVVTAIDEGELFLDSNIVLEHAVGSSCDVEEKQAVESSMFPIPGREVTVQTHFRSKRRGMILECQHRLYMEVNVTDGKTNRRLLAQATVTIMALKGSTHRPTSKLPQWFLDKLM